MRILQLLFSSFILFFVLNCCCLPSCDAGTLIVTYNTGQDGERLDRVRFLLTDDKLKQVMYPKGNGYVEDSVSRARIVVIEDLSPGEYTLDFFVPNTDGFFQEITPRKFYMGHETVLKLDQVIVPAAET